LEKSEILKKVGKRIKEVRLQKGISQADLVGRMEGNIDATNISRIEAGRTNPTVFTLFRIAEALGVPLNELMLID
jgi:transcriptional regulator with XRE-family HTH domain